ncbi:hypothetical protein BGZ81_000253, partial [Podila clonocystis]
MAGSSITAKTNLPFLKGAPIVAVKQDIDILDTAGNHIGRLTTGFEPANYSGAFVSTITVPAALIIYPEAQEKTYPDFINGMNMAMTTYKLGLCGTADSILNLGDLGNITITGIKLNVKTTLNGLQGLADVKYLNLVTLLPTGDRLGAIVLVSIHNPSKLTLKIGNLTLSAGLNYMREGYGADTILTDLNLMPGKNEVIMATIVNQKKHLWVLLSWATLLASILCLCSLYLMPLPGASKNPALDTGLCKTLDWNLDISALAANDGIFYVSTTVRNPFYGLDFNVVSVNSALHNPAGSYDPSRLDLLTPMDVIRDDIFYLIPPNPYLLKGGESK